MKVRKAKSNKLTDSPNMWATSSYTFKDGTVLADRFLCANPNGLRLNVLFIDKNEVKGEALSAFNRLVEDFNVAVHSKGDGVFVKVDESL